MNALALKFEMPYVEGIHPHSKINQLVPHNSVWNAFQAGMKVLYRYANRSNADSISIAKANLQLLHHTLLNDSAYRETLETTKQAIPNNGLPCSHNLLVTEGFRADLITIQKGCNIRLTSRINSISMFMIISGKTAVSLEEDKQNKKIQSEQPKPWWKRKSDTSSDNLNLEGDVILILPGNNEQKTLSALDKNCLLLCVSLPIDQQALNR